MLRSLRTDWIKRKREKRLKRIVSNVKVVIVSPFCWCSICGTDDMHWSSCNASDCFRRAHTSLLSLSAAIIMLKTKWNWITGSALGINSMNLDWLKEHRVGWRLAWCMAWVDSPRSRPSIPKESGEAQKIACRWATSSSPIRLRELKYFATINFNYWIIYYA